MNRDTLLGATCLVVGIGACTFAGGWVGFLGATTALIGLALLMWTKR